MILTSQRKVNCTLFYYNNTIAIIDKEVKGDDDQAIKSLSTSNVHFFKQLYQLEYIVSNLRVLKAGTYEYQLTQSDIDMENKALNPGSGVIIIIKSSILCII